MQMKFIKMWMLFILNHFFDNGGRDASTSYDMPRVLTVNQLLKKGLEVLQARLRWELSLLVLPHPF